MRRRDTDAATTSWCSNGYATATSPGAATRAGAAAAAMKNAAKAHPPTALKIPRRYRARASSAFASAASASQISVCSSSSSGTQSSSPPPSTVGFVARRIRGRRARSDACSRNLEVDASMLSFCHRVPRPDV